jgi:hypothetical protein
MVAHLYAESFTYCVYMFINIVAYLLRARTVESHTKPRKTVHYATIDEAMFSPCRAKLCRATPSRASLVATQHCDKHISAAANQHATVKKDVCYARPANVAGEGGR